MSRILLLSLLLLKTGLVFPQSSAPAQSSTPDRGLQNTFTTFQKCLQTRQSACLRNFLGSKGLSFGPNDRQFTRRDFLASLSSEKPLRCSIWGEDCKQKPSAFCSLRMLTQQDH